MSMNDSKRRYQRIIALKRRLWRHVSILMFVVGVCAVSVAGVGLEGDIELLKLVATVHKANRDSIGTWQGNAKSEIIYADANGALVHHKYSAAFLLDTKQDAIRCKWSEEERLQRKEGRLVSDGVDLETVNSMKKGDGYYKYAHGYVLGDGTKLNSLVIWPRYKARNEVYQSGFDPMRYMTGHVTKCADDLVERLMWYYKEANNPELIPGTIKRNGDIVTLETVSEAALNRHEFDLSKGGNVVRYYAKSDGGTELREWTYEQKDGAWVPKTFSMELKYAEPQNSLINYTTRIRKVTFADNTLNRPIPASEFSLEALGLKVGERVTDQVKGIAYIYGVSEEIPLEDEEAFSKGTVVAKTETDKDKQGVTVTETQGQRPGLSDDAASKQPTAGQIEPRNKTRYFVLGLIVLLIIGLSTFAIVKKFSKGGEQP